jgi:hypothetical protein
MDKIKEAILSTPNHTNIEQMHLATKLHEENGINESYSIGFYQGYESAQEELGIELDAAIKMRDKFGRDIDDLGQEIERLKCCGNCKHESPTIKAPCNTCGIIVTGFKSNWDAKK